MMENNNSSFVLEYFVGEIVGTRWKPCLFFQFVPCHNLFCLGVSLSEERRTRSTMSLSFPVRSIPQIAVWHRVHCKRLATFPVVWGQEMLFQTYIYRGPAEGWHRS